MKSMMKLKDWYYDTHAIAMVFLMTASFPAFAAGGSTGGGLGTVSKFLDHLNSGLKTLAGVAVITAIIVSGFKIMFNGESLRDCKGWIIGAALCVGAEEIGKMLWGSS